MAERKLRIVSRAGKQTGNEAVSLVKPGGVWSQADGSRVSSYVFMPKADRMTLHIKIKKIKIQLPCIFVLGSLLACLQSRCYH